MEHLLNVYAAKNARGAVAEFLGYCEVARGQASAKLTEGVWLVRPASGHAWPGRSLRAARRCWPAGGHASVAQLVHGMGGCKVWVRPGQRGPAIACSGAHWARCPWVPAMTAS
jgi:hypothetical protein